MRKITLDELNNLLLTRQSFKFKPTNKKIFKLIVTLCSIHGICFPCKTTFKYASQRDFVSIDTWCKREDYFIATPVMVEDQNQEEIELILPTEFLV